MKNQNEFPEDLQECIKFHGHICPGMIYGYKVAKEAIRLFKTDRSIDEEIVAICENDSCAIDAIQVMLGTTAGKGNLIINNYGKNAYIVYSRKNKISYRFSRKKDYSFTGKDKMEFEELEKKFSSDTATESERKRQKYLKTIDLLEQPFSNIFETSKADVPEPSFAPLAQSVACESCCEMTMETKLIERNGKKYCIPCNDKL